MLSACLGDTWLGTQLGSTPPSTVATPRSCRPADPPERGRPTSRPAPATGQSLFVMMRRGIRRRAATLPGRPPRQGRRPGHAAVPPGSDRLSRPERRRGALQFACNCAAAAAERARRRGFMPRAAPAPAAEQDRDVGRGRRSQQRRWIALLNHLSHAMPAES